jgi:anti-sigma regulatory factor (Ser/Thr protein kinase)
MTLELHAIPEDVMRAVDSLREFGQARQVPEKALFGLALALEECGSNIVNHAFHRDPAQKFQILIEHTGDAISIELHDRGPEFDPTKPPVLARAPGQDLGQAGGWGIQLVRRYIDEIQYRRESGENVLRLTKRLGEAKAKDFKT